MSPSSTPRRESVVSYRRPVVDRDVVRWEGTLRGRDEFIVEMEFTSPDPGRFRPTGRPWLLVFLQAAMRWGEPLVVDGPVDQGTIDNLMEWQEAQVAWHRDEITVVPIRADVERRPRAPKRDMGAITAFSGGVDSCFTLVRHATRHPESAYRTADLKAGLMVHGFDISARSDRDFPEAYARSTRMLAAYGVAPYRLRTNLQQVGRSMGYLWGVSSHGISIAAALACFEQYFGQTMIPSSYPYDHQILPWGSTPMTDHLLGSRTRPLWHDGAAFDKLDKVTAFAHEAPIAADLRVCHAGRQRNCGTCFKCLTTQACFWINGVDRPACFSAGASVEELAGLDLSDSYKLLLGGRMRDAAARAGRADIAAAMATALNRTSGVEA